MPALNSHITTITAALALAGLQIGLFAWLKADIGALDDRMVTVEREVDFMRGQLSQALPAPTQSKSAAEEGSG